jgi:hypothetical protein
LIIKPLQIQGPGSGFNKSRIRINNSVFIPWPREGRLSYRETFSPQKRKASLSKHRLLHFFCRFFFCPPRSGSAFPMRIRIQMTKINGDLHTDPDPQAKQCTRLRYRYIYIIQKNIEKKCMPDLRNKNIIDKDRYRYRIATEGDLLIPSAMDLLNLSLTCSYGSLPVLRPRSCG